VAHSLSARKRHRQSLVRQERNRSRRSTTRSAVTAARDAIASGNADEAQAAVRAAAAILDRTAQKGVIHANNASRRKSRLMRQLNAMGGSAEAAAAPKRRAANTTKARKPASRGAKKS
jgi:small subunit ribosomal protein S20